MPPEVRETDAVGAFAALVGAPAAAALGVRAARRRFARGQALMHAGQVPSDVFLLSAGVVKVSATTEAGRDVLLAFRGPGDLVGELAALDDRPRSATVLAIDPVEALAVGRDAFRALVDAHPPMAQGLLRELSARLREADARRVRLVGYTTMGRVAYSLLELCDRFGSTGDDAVRIVLPLSQEDLASLSGASLESVGRALQSMRGLGWIETRRRDIRVLDPGALRGALV